MGPKRVVPIGVAVIAVAAACASDGEIAVSPVTATPDSARSTPAPTAPTTLTASTVAETTTTTASTSSTSSTSTRPAPETTSTTASSSTTATDPVPTTLPGEPIDPIFTPAGAELVAVGVPFDEPLVLRTSPGDDQPEIATLPPLAEGIVSTGRARSLGVRSAWLEVTLGEEIGWLPLLNLLYDGRTEDATDRFVDLIGRVPIAPSMLELGQLVAESIAPTDFEVPTRIVAVTEPFDGATGEVTFDVLDLPDDSVGGQRLHVTGRALLDTDTTDSGLAGYELVTVEATALCRRGAGPDGLCP